MPGWTLAPTTSAITLLAIRKDSTSEDVCWTNLRPAPEIAKSGTRSKALGTRATFAQMPVRRFCKESLDMPFATTPRRSVLRTKPLYSNQQPTVAANFESAQTAGCRHGGPWLRLLHSADLTTEPRTREDHHPARSPRSDLTQFAGVVDLCPSILLSVCSISRSGSDACTWR